MYHSNTPRPLLRRCSISKTIASASSFPTSLSSLPRSTPSCSSSSPKTGAAKLRSRAAFWARICENECSFITVVARYDIRESGDGEYGRRLFEGIGTS